MTGRFPSKTTKSKRRKLGESRQATREPSPEDVLYAIRDIIDEKRVKGKLLYKVDWADHPTTGKRYDPTWVCFPFRQLTIFQTPATPRPLLISLSRRL